MSDVNRPQRFRFNSNLELLQNVRRAARFVITSYPFVCEVAIEFGFRENKQRTENEEKKQSYSNPTAEGDNRCHVSHPKRAQIHSQITISIHFVDAVARDASSGSFVTLWNCSQSSAAAVAETAAVSLLSDLTPAAAAASAAAEAAAAAATTPSVVSEWWSLNAR